MDICLQYAKALASITHPDMKNFRAALKRRDHESLMPRIYAQYQKLIAARERATIYAKVTPEGERTRILLELYRKLTHNG